MNLHPLLSAIFALFSTIGFAVLFNIPRRSLLLAGLCGALGWTVLTLSHDAGASLAGANFLGAMSVGMAAELMAIAKRQPATLFLVPGIIPLVPGYGLYRTVQEIIAQNQSAAAAAGFETILVALVIATALLLSASASRIVRRVFFRKKTPS